MLKDLTIFDLFKSFVQRVLLLLLEPLKMEAKCYVVKIKETQSSALLLFTKEKKMNLRIEKSYKFYFHILVQTTKATCHIKLTLLENKRIRKLV
jgi:hypothetical protein